MNILLIAVMFIFTILFSMLGQGGGSVYTPIQLMFGVNFYQAAATSQLLIIISAFSSTIIFGRGKTVDWKLALMLEISTASGAFLGGYLSEIFSDKMLSFFFACLLFIASYFMLKRYEERIKAHKGGFLTCWKREVGGLKYSVNLLIGLPICLVLGFFAGMLGISGGTLKVPIMVLLLGVPMKIAVGSSAFMVMTTASGGFLGNLVGGHFNAKVGLIIAAAVFLGGQIGARISLKTKSQTLKKYLILIAIWLIYRALS